MQAGEPPARRLRSPALGVALVLLALLGALPAAANATVVSSAQAIAWLNAQRAANGIPGELTDNPDWDAGCADHLSWWAQNPNAPNPHIETPGTPGYTDNGAAAGASSVLAGGLDWAADSSYPWGEADPWETAPIHLMQLLGPGLQETGWADDGSRICMITWNGYTRPDPPAPELLSYPGNGTSFIYASEQASEWPFTPADFVGLPEGATTGPYLYVLGYGTGAGSITSATLTGPSGEVPVRTVDNTTTGAQGDLGSYLPPGGIIIPVSPLAPGATYMASVTFQPQGGGPLLSLTWSFSTALQGNSVDVTADPEGDTVQITVSSDAPNPQLTLTGPQSLAPGLDAGGAVTLTLPAGTWRACASSGGGSSGYQPASGCTQFTVVAASTRPATGGPPRGSGGSGHACRVPRLLRMTVAQAARALRRAGCRLGRVSRARAARHVPRVVRQSAQAGARRAGGYAVALTVR